VPGIVAQLRRGDERRIAAILRAREAGLRRDGVALFLVSLWIVYLDNNCREK
jgi:hypothetical protein